MRNNKFRCPNPQCREVLLIPEKLHGVQVKCAKCGEQFLVPPPNTATWQDPPAKSETIRNAI